LTHARLGSTVLNMPFNLTFMTDDVPEVPYEIARDWMERNKPQVDNREQIQLDIPYDPRQEPPKSSDSSVIIIEL
jgi:hypothetical protein